MHNKPHTEQAKRNMRLARQAQPKKWDCLPELDIVERLLHTDATTRSIAKEYGCSDATIKTIFRRHTTKEQRLAVKTAKQSKKLKGKGNPEIWKFAKWKGRNHTEDAKEKMSLAKKGKSSLCIKEFGGAQECRELILANGIALRQSGLKGLSKHQSIKSGVCPFSPEMTGRAKTARLVEDACTHII